MASLNRRGKAWSVQFRDRYGKKWTIGLGTVTKRTAEEIRGHINRIVEAHLTATSLSPQVARWLADLDPKLRDKLAATGVCPSGAVSSGLKATCDRYVELKRGTIGASTLTRLKMATRDLVEKLGADTALDRITDADAIEFRRWLLVDRGRAEATTRKIDLTDAVLHSLCVAVAQHNTQALTAKVPGALKAISNAGRHDDSTDVPDGAMDEVRERIEVGQIEIN